MRQTERDRLGAVRRVIFMALALNVFAASGKLGYGYATSTLGLVADGYHSLLDIAANVIALVGATLAAAPPDAEHQYGHRKFEVLSSMGISLFIFAGAAEVLHEALERVAAGSQAVAPRITWFSFALMAATFVLGFLLSRYEARRAKELGSRLLESDAAHTWGDVAAAGTVIGGLALTRFVHPVADVVVAFALGFYLVRVGYKVVMRNVGVVTDRAVLPPAEVERVVRDFPGVKGSVRIRTRGQDEHVFLDMVLLVDPDLTVASAHELVDRLESRLSQAFPGLADIVIHVEPAPRDEAGPSEAALVREASASELG